MHAQPQTAFQLLHEVVQDKQNSNDWRVEALDIKTGDAFVTIFSGPNARVRATEYANFKNNPFIFLIHAYDHIANDRMWPLIARRRAMLDLWKAAFNCV